MSRILWIITHSIEIQIGRLSSLRNAIGDWADNERTPVKSYYDRIEDEGRMDEWLVDQAVDDRYSIDSTVRIAYAALTIGVASCVESHVWRMCGYAGIGIKPHKSGGTPGWGCMKDKLEEWIGKPFQFSDLRGFEDGVNRARLLANRFKHNDGRKNADDVKEFNGNEGDRIAYEKEDIDQLISKAKEFLISLLNEVTKKKGDSAYAGKENIMPTTGEKPGKGTYKCRKCGTTVTLDDDSDTLPPCPGCSGTEFDKIS